MGELGFEIFKEMISPIGKIPLGDYILDNWLEIVCKARAIRRVKEIELPLARDVIKLCKQEREATQQLNKLLGYGKLDPAENDYFETLIERFTEIGIGEVEFRGKPMKEDILSKVAQRKSTQFTVKFLDKIMEPYKAEVYRRSEIIVDKVLKFLGVQKIIDRKTTIDPNNPVALLLQSSMEFIRGYNEKIFDKPSGKFEKIKNKRWASKDLRESSIIDELEEYKKSITENIKNINEQIAGIKIEKPDEDSLLENLTIIPIDQIENMNIRKLIQEFIKLQNEIVNSRVQLSIHKRITKEEQIPS